MVDVIGSLIGGSTLGGNAIGAAIVRLRLDSSDYQRQMQTAQVETQAGANAMGASTSKFAAIGKAALLGVGAAAVGFGVIAVKAASDLGEAVNKSNVIFGDNAREIEEWAETGAEAFGLSKTSALDAAASFGQIVQNAGLSVDASADMSMAMVQLAGDMASFNNEDPTDMLERIRSGLAGEVEPLRRFGVDLSAATVESKAMALGLADAHGELDAGAKIQARYAILMEQTTKQQGDFQRTADSLPNQMRTLKAEFINTAAAVGEKLLPAFVDILHAVNDILDAAEPLLDFLGDVIRLGAEAISVLANLATGDFEALKSGFVPAAETFERLVKAFDDGEISALEFANRIARLKEETGFNVELTDEWQTKIHEAVEAQRQLRQSTLPSVAALERQATATEEVTGETDKARKTIVEFAHMTGKELKEWQDDIEESFDAFTLGLEDMTSQSDVTARDFERATNHMVQQARQLSRAMLEIKEEKWVNENFIEFLSEQGPEWLIGFSKLTKEEQQKAQDAWKETTIKTDEAKGSLDRILGAMDKIDKKEAKGKVIIEYEYMGFDPTKPGMAGVQRAR